jgi:UPF0755 protein
LRLLIPLGTIMFLILMVAYFFYGLQPVAAGTGAAAKLIEFKIAKGDGFKDIGAELSRESLIKSLAVFKLYSLVTGRVQKFQPGLYDISPSMSIPEIVRALTVGGKNEAVVTIPEGSTLKDIDRMIRGAGVTKASIVDYQFKQLASYYPYLADVNSLEGFLFPDTYRFNIDSSVEDVVRIFLNNFNSKGWPMLQGTRNWYDNLILASLLEREVPEFNDRQIVAGILLKRLSLKIPLQVDATIGYAKCNGEIKDCENLLVTKEDLKISSPYNTYQRLGLTPTPISNPGESAIKAAISPQTSAYLYYLTAAKTKETLFSKTLDEHNTKRVKYL